ARCLQCHRLTARIGTADQKRAAVPVERQSEWHDAAFGAAEHVHQQRMAGVFEVQPAVGAKAEFWYGAIEIDRKARLREDQVERGDHTGRGPDRIAMESQPVRQFAQDAEDLPKFLLLQADQLVVEIDGIERLDEERLSGGTRAMN